MLGQSLQRTVTVCPQGQWLHPFRGSALIARINMRGQSLRALFSHRQEGFLKEAGLLLGLVRMGGQEGD